MYEFKLRLLCLENQEREAGPIYSGRIQLAFAGCGCAARQAQGERKKDETSSDFRLAQVVLSLPMGATQRKPTFYHCERLSYVIASVSEAIAQYYNIGKIASSLPLLAMTHILCSSLR